MKYGVMMAYGGTTGNHNIGDFIQAIAGRQFLPRVDAYLDRETDLAAYHDEPMKMIMNGWFTNNTADWPPSEKIIPLLVSFHINKAGLPGLLSEESIRFYREHEHVGCRDTNTLSILQKHGIKAYFSACLTLTLGRTYATDHKSDEILFVDPYELKGSLKSRYGLQAAAFLLTHPLSVRKVCRKRGEKGLSRVLRIAYFLSEHSKVFDLKMLVEAHYILYGHMKLGTNYPTVDDKLALAESLIRRYAAAKAVITTRIHCALPCLGLETPVIYMERENDTEQSTMRMGGVKDLFNIVSWDGQCIHNKTEVGKITAETFPENKSLWRKYADGLAAACERFIGKEE